MIRDEHIAAMVRSFVRRTERNEGLDQLALESGSLHLLGELLDRLRGARQLLLSVEPAASVAAAVGYVDQSHLTKRFRAAFGVTPKQFAVALA